MSRFFCLLVCLGVCSWTSVPGADRDSSAVASAIAEHLSPTGLFLQEVYRNPAAQYRHYDHNLTRIELSGSYKQEEHAVIDQIGQGFRYAAFHADSYIRRGNHTIWGSAGTAQVAPCTPYGTKVPILNCSTPTFGAIR